MNWATKIWIRSCCLWDMHRRVDHSVVPEGMTVVHFAFSGVRGHSRNWWLVINSGEVDMCDIDPGFDVAVSVSAGLRQMTEIWRGNLTWSDAIRSGDVTISGPTALRRSLPSWFELSTFASIPPPRVARSLTSPVPSCYRAVADRDTVDERVTTCR